MTWAIYLTVIAGTFGVLFLGDTLFRKFFRKEHEYQTGMVVHLNKRLLIAGILLTVLGIAMLGQLAKGFNWIIVAASVILEIMGIGLLIYYNSFGVFFDLDTFICRSFRQKAQTYRYEDILSQQLFTTAGGIMVELDLRGGRTLTLQQNMDGMYSFLDHACFARLRQLGQEPRDCKWFDKSQSCWFPPREEQ